MLGNQLNVLLKDKYSRYFGSVILALFCIALALVRIQNDRIIERVSINHFRIREIIKADGLYLRMRGAARHPCVGPTTPSVNIVNDEMSVTVRRSFLWDQKDFDFLVKVPNGVKRVVFGNTKIEIWPRDVQGIQYSRQELQAIKVARLDFTIRYPNIKENEFYFYIEEPFPRRFKSSIAVTFVKESSESVDVTEYFKYEIEKDRLKIVGFSESYGGYVNKITEFILQKEEAKRRSTQ